MSRQESRTTQRPERPRYRDQASGVARESEARDARPTPLPSPSRTDTTLALAHATVRTAAALRARSLAELRAAPVENRELWVETADDSGIVVRYLDLAHRPVELVRVVAWERTAATLVVVAGVDGIEPAEAGR